MVSNQEKTDDNPPIKVYTRRKRKCSKMSSVATTQDDNDEPLAQVTDKSPVATNKTNKKRKKTTNEKEKEKEKIDDYYPFFGRFTFEPTRYIDKCTLEKLGILEDVETVLGDMGLTQFITMQHPTYEILTRQFLATVEIHYSSVLHQAENGYITFTVGGTKHQVTFATLCNIFGFHGAHAVQKTETQFSNMPAPSELWEMVGNGQYNPGSSKARKIRSPVLRYAHMVLANTIFERIEKNAVKKGEYFLLMEGVSEYLRARDGSNLQDRSSPNLGAVLAERLVEYKDWAHTVWESEIIKGKKKPSIGIGGIITPILLYCKVNLDDADLIKESNPTIDGPHLIHRSFLAGISERSHLVYRFETEENNKAFIELPNPELTSIASRDNILFSPPVELRYSGERLPMNKSKWPNIEAIEKEADREEDGPETEISNAWHGIGQQFDLPPPLLDALFERPTEKWLYEVVIKQQRELAELRGKLAQLLGELAQQKRRRRKK